MSRPRRDKNLEEALARMALLKAVKAWEKPLIEKTDQQAFLRRLITTNGGGVKRYDRKLACIKPHTPHTLRVCLRGQLSHRGGSKNVPIEDFFLHGKAVVDNDRLRQCERTFPSRAAKVSATPVAAPDSALARITNIARVRAAWQNSNPLKAAIDKIQWRDSGTDIPFFAAFDQVHSSSSTTETQLHDFGTLDASTSAVALNEAPPHEFGTLDASTSAVALNEIPPHDFGTLDASSAPGLARSSPPVEEISGDVLLSSNSPSSSHIQTHGVDGVINGYPFLASKEFADASQHGLTEEHPVFNAQPSVDAQTSAAQQGVDCGGIGDVVAFGSAVPAPATFGTSGTPGHVEMGPTATTLDLDMTGLDVFMGWDAAGDVGYGDFRGMRDLDLPPFDCAPPGSTTIETSTTPNGDTTDFDAMAQDLEDVDWDILLNWNAGVDGTVEG
ncbi:hypothetical protein AC578_7781 [Pseudocercospora eumusae]|uniref:Uncharacterized protein n=1 Tax=Pseudocercospora eumusae TaxID=321146 RepID=A0A139H116_9PEZI|nr:hypothetical protein AC578_7781 [Pseudocercospora eumusae]